MLSLNLFFYLKCLRLFLTRVVRTIFSPSIKLWIRWIWKGTKLKEIAFIIRCLCPVVLISVPVQCTQEPTLRSKWAACEIITVGCVFRVGCSFCPFFDAKNKYCVFRRNSITCSISVFLKWTVVVLNNITRRTTKQSFSADEEGVVWWTTGLGWFTGLIPW